VGADPEAAEFFATPVNFIPVRNGLVWLPLVRPPIGPQAADTMSPPVRPEQALLFLRRLGRTDKPLAGEFASGDPPTDACLFTSPEDLARLWFVGPAKLCPLARPPKCSGALARAAEATAAGHLTRHFSTIARDNEAVLLGMPLPFRDPICYHLAYWTWRGELCKEPFPTDLGSLASDERRTALLHYCTSHQEEGD
jgi:hypothetical protein